MKKGFVLAVFILAAQLSFAQSSTTNSSSYKTAVGVKFYPGAVSVKHFVNDQAAIEGLGYFFNRGVRVTGLYEFHFDIEGAKGLKWYAGPGAHLGFYNNKYGGGSFAGIDGVLGLDYKVNTAPLNFSLDWQPSFEFGNGYQNGFTGNWGGFAIRYTL